MRFNPLDYPTLFNHSAFLTETISWAGHIPFAYLLIELARPSVFVELGTFSGMSYGNFCEAVKISNTGTKCFGIDTWRGDENLGKYSEEVLQGLKARHDPRFGSFSTLIQSTFDEALDKFEDGSIDILHIDGCHFYEAVCHDFESWKPKLSDAGIVLFHDTAEIREGFGVHRLWDEISQKYPSFEFKHSAGLGVLGVGKSLPVKFVQFLEDANSNPASIQDLFRVLSKSYFGEIKLRLMLSDVVRLLAAICQYQQNSGQAVDPLPDIREMMKEPVMYSRGAAEKGVSIIRGMKE